MISEVKLLFLSIKSGSFEESIFNCMFCKLINLNNCPNPVDFIYFLIGQHFPFWASRFHFHVNYSYSLNDPPLTASGCCGEWGLGAIWFVNPHRLPVAFRIQFKILRWFTKHLLVWLHSISHTCCQFITPADLSGHKVDISSMCPESTISSSLRWDSVET